MFVPQAKSQPGNFCNGITKIHTEAEGIGGKTRYIEFFKVAPAEKDRIAATDGIDRVIRIKEREVQCLLEVTAINTDIDTNIQ